MRNNTKANIFDDTLGLFENESEVNRKSGVSNEIQLPPPNRTIDFSFADAVASSSERTSYESKKRISKAKAKMTEKSLEKEMKTPRRA